MTFDKDEIIAEMVFNINSYSDKDIISCNKVAGDCYYVELFDNEFNLSVDQTSWYLAGLQEGIVLGETSFWRK